MGEAITTIGNLAGACGHDGTDWVKLLVDEDGKLQIEIDTSALPTGAATAANQTTMITALQLIDDLRGALDSVDTDELVVNVDESALPTGAATAANQTTMITALQLIDDLRNALDSVGTDELDVNVEASVLPTGAATSANQTTMITALQLIDDLRAALNSVATDELDVVIDGQSGDVEVAQTTPADLTVAQHQYDGSAWRKSNLLWGFHDQYQERILDESLDAGTNIVDGTAVPEGEIWIVTTIAGKIVSGSITLFAFGLSGSVTSVPVETQQPPVSGTWYVWNGSMVLIEGDKIYGSCLVATAGDDMDLRVAGYKMDIAM